MDSGNSAAQRIRPSACHRKKKSRRIPGADVYFCYVDWIALQKAFDKVWADGLLVKLQRAGSDRNYSTCYIRLKLVGYITKGGCLKYSCIIMLILTMSL